VRKRISDQLPTVVLVVLLVIVVVAMSGLSRHFLAVSNLLSAVQLAAPIGIIAIGMTFVVLIGGIDLSVGSTFALSAVAVGMLCAAGLPLPLAALLGLVVGVLCGLLNGVLVSALGLPSIVVTIATMAGYRGLALALSGGSSFPIPADLAFLGQGYVAGVPMAVLILLVVFAVAAVMLMTTPYGDRIYALGANARALRFAAQRSRRLTLSAYVVAGLLSAVAAIVYATMVSSAKANFGTGYELAAVTIVVVGGVALTGGRGSLWGALLATVVIALLQNGLSISFVPTEIQTMFVGGALVLTAVIYRWLPPLLVAGRRRDTVVDGGRTPSTATHPATPTKETKQ
jgi:ribose/xylose/arabinose/galactoside ABC-type transport system permease subunit